jgi:hypothetical protein
MHLIFRNNLLRMIMKLTECLSLTYYTGEGVVGPARGGFRGARTRSLSASSAGKFYEYSWSTRQFLLDNRQLLVEL